MPGGRYTHIASALMSITTARVAGVEDVTAVSPPCMGGPIPDEMLYTMDLAGATRILCIGGVQGVAAMAFGLFGAPVGAPERAEPRLASERLGGRSVSASVARGARDGFCCAGRGVDLAEP